MKQILLRKGNVHIEEVPVPSIIEGCVLVEVKYSFISSGTELSSLTTSGESLLTKARKQPDKVKKVLEQLPIYGLTGMIDKIRRELDLGKPTGYSCSGIVKEVGKGIDDLKPGDMVACAGDAYHAEFVCVHRNLVVKIPENCSVQDASSVALGAIALQGVRRADNRIGETVTILGTGLIGLLTLQILKAAGCKVIAVDISDDKLNIARELGADFTINLTTEDLIFKVNTITRGWGSDSVIITASSGSSEVTNTAMEIVRKKGKVVVVGAVGMNLKRKPFYEKEADFLISCSYGPGRYDENYEILGNDYPYPYVRWTENRNMNEYLELIASKKIDLSKLPVQVFAFSEASKAFNALATDKKMIAAILRYGEIIIPRENYNFSRIVLTNRTFKKNKINTAIIGAGSFAISNHLPNLKKLSQYYSIGVVVDRNPYKAKEIARQFGAKYATTNINSVLNDKDIDLVIITTRHNQHAELVIASAKAGKSVFVEKPLAMNPDELKNIVNIIKEFNTPLMVGFNRRFSPFSKKIKEKISNRVNPLVINYRVNAGNIPLDHWTRGPQGGGRIIGEACHMFDLMNYFTSSKPIDVISRSIRNPTHYHFVKDNFSATISYEDGSFGNLIYTSFGSPKLQKEYIEIYCDGNVYIINDFLSLELYENSNKKIKSWKVEKGYLEELEEFAKSLLNKTEIPISLDEIIFATEISFIVDKQISDGLNLAPAL
ncbi:MAG: Gfo/Idh/MocA family oxidoreductase [Ignavibacteria bacterium]|nr:Gfo/Idh/MocA family oxidoreductase [Ignavibacteria bacterium]